MKTAICKCCEREFTYMVVKGEVDRVYCSICDKSNFTRCVAKVHCNIHTNPQNGWECDCTTEVVADTVVTFSGHATKGES